MLIIFSTFIELPNNWLASTTMHIGNLFSDISPIFFLIIGILLGTFLLEWLISLLK